MLQMKELFYEQTYQQLISDTSVTSARIIIPLLLDLIQPTSVVDVGCGVGAWLGVFQEHGLSDVTGVDGDYVDKNILKFPQERFVVRDLTSGAIGLHRQYDLAVCLEMAEYLPSENSEALVQSLTDLAPVVMFSSSIPGQGGPLEINPKWQHEWAELFEKQGYYSIDCIRPQIWKNPDVAVWYAQNIMLYVHRDYLAQHVALQHAYEANKDNILSMIHPSLWLNTQSQHRTFKDRLTRFLYRLLGKKSNLVLSTSTCYLYSDYLYSDVYLASELLLPFAA